MAPYVVMPRMANSLLSLHRLPGLGAPFWSCWNLTFAFDSSVNPRLVAAVYDHWEW